MKARRRHELKESDLAHALQMARRYLDENSKRVTVVVVLVGVAAAAVLFAVRSRAAALEDVWRRKAQLTFDDPTVGKESLASLASMTKSVSDERFVFASLVEQGQEALRLAKEVSAPPDPDFNEKAREAFEKLLKRFPKNPMAKGIARLGLATVEENAFVLTGDFAHEDRARVHLNAVIDDAALNGMPFQRMASDRLASLDATFTRVEFVYSGGANETEPVERPDNQPADSAEIQFDSTDDLTAPPEAAETGAHVEPADPAEPGVDDSAQPGHGEGSVEGMEPFSEATP